jgi:hypothetical protein
VRSLIHHQRKSNRTIVLNLSNRPEQMRRNDIEYGLNKENIGRGWGRGASTCTDVAVRERICRIKPYNEQAISLIHTENTLHSDESSTTQPKSPLAHMRPHPKHGGKHFESQV